MKKKMLMAALALFSLGLTVQNHRAMAAEQVTSSTAKQAEIKFDTLRINFGTFSEKQAEQKCTFTFTNVGDAPLVINQAFASCGCTVPTYTKDPVKPGEKGQVEVTYNGKGKFPGRFSKTITIRSNAKTELVRLVIEGDMTK